MNWRKALTAVVITLLLGAGGGDLQAAKLKKHRVVRRGKARAKKKPALPPPPPKPQASGPAANISLAKQYMDLANYPQALQEATTAATRVPTLNDYAQYYRAAAAYQLKNYDVVNSAVPQVLNEPLGSPLTGQAAVIGVSGFLDAGKAPAAFDMVKKYFQKMPQPQASLLLARCLLANGDLPQATEYFQRVYYYYPNSKEAADAGTALADLKKRLEDGYPPVTPARILARVSKLLDARRTTDAKNELNEAIPQLSGVERDQARVRVGEADYRAGKPAEALAYLKDLKVDDSEADAERQSFMVRCARRLDKKSEVNAYLDELAHNHPNSEWRLDTLITVADQARADNERAVYVPLFKSCATEFPTNGRSVWCAWRVAFDEYWTHQVSAGDTLLNYIKQHPDSPDTSNALYFLGRWYESKNNPAAARASYDVLLDRLPNTYYAVLAQPKVKSDALAQVTPDAALLTTLRACSWPAREETPSFSPGPLAQKRLARAKLLQTSGMNELAEDELKYGSRNEDGQQNVYAFEMAKIASAHGAPDEALRYIKTFAPGYLYKPLDRAPLEFWRLAFPMPYRVAIEQYSRDQGLDPFLVAALIRQESEFNPRSVSPANAYGLMQVLPSTGRQLAKHFGIRRFNSALLFVPDRNIQLGTYFFRTLMDNAGGQPEIALAAYNAGPTRSVLWRSWGPFQEPAEFAEVVPFYETRGYIQVVLRNADIYRRLYAGTHADIPAYRPAPRPVVSKTPVKKSVKRRASAHKRRRRKR